MNAVGADSSAQGAEAMNNGSFLDEKFEVKFCFGKAVRVLEGGHAGAQECAEFGIEPGWGRCLHQPSLNSSDSFVGVSTISRPPAGNIKVFSTTLLSQSMVAF